MRESSLRLQASTLFSLTRICQPPPTGAKERTPQGAKSLWVLFFSRFNGTNSAPHSGGSARLNAPRWYPQIGKGIPA